MALTQISTKGIKDGTITGTDLATNVDLVDNQYLRIGTGNDLQIFHDGSHSRIVDSGTGNLILQGSRIVLNNAASSENMVTATENGAVELYFDGGKKFETTSAGTKHGDAVKGAYGNDQDLLLYHESGVNYIQTVNSTNLEFYAGSDKAIRYVANGAVELFYDNSRKFRTHSSGVVFEGNLNGADNNRLTLGDSDDLQIYHDGTDSYILENGSGVLNIKTNGTSIDLTKTPHENLARFIVDGAVELYHNNSKKFETTSDGVTVSGKLHISHGNELGLYTSGPYNFQAKFESTDAEAAIVIEDSNSTNDGNRIGVISDNMTFITANTERMRIDSSGHFLFNCTSLPSSSVAGVAFEKNGSSGVLFHSNGSSTGSINVAEFINGNGTVGRINTDGSTTTYHTSSDYRLKENQIAISDGITRLKSLKPYRFNFKADSIKTVDGFFAHEVSPVVPEAIWGEKDAVKEDGSINPQGIDQSKLVPLLVAALQEAIAKIEVLETEVAALKAS